MKFAYFSGEPLGVPTLDILKEHGLVPSVIICNPDRPQGRNLLLTPPPVKVWAEANDIQVIQPESLKDETFLHELKSMSWDLFVVVAYSKIIPKSILTMPTHGTINMHPSLLPKFRGTSPIRSTILADTRTTGVTIMLMDEEMDHGPILAQESITIAESEWPIHGRDLDTQLGTIGAKLLARTIPAWMSGTIEPTEQDHEKATYTKKMTKEMGEINLSTDPYQNLLKIRAYDVWPGTYFFTEKKGKQIRIKIIDAEIASDGSLKILRIVPEGKKEMSFEEFFQS